MPLIPSNTKRYGLDTSTDSFGNVWYVKNISFRKKGYAKLASRSVAVDSEKADDNFQLPLSFGRESAGEFLIATAKYNYILFLSPSASFGAAADAGANVPTNSQKSRGRWFNNKWHVTTDTQLKYKTISSGNWSDSGLTFTSGYVHALEVFRSRATICVTDGNVVHQYDTSYATTNLYDLTIPADYEAIMLSYNSEKMAVITKLASSVTGQNQNAFMYVWDGKGTAANGSYDTGSDMILMVAPYQSQWIILTRVGELKVFNGSGFKTLCTLPFWYMKILWGDGINLSSIGDCMVVEGDNILFNIPAQVNNYWPNQQSYLENHPGGILTYDPLVGLSHTYSPSASMLYKLTVPTANVGTTTSILTTNDSTTIPDTGNEIKYYAASTGIGGLTNNTIYYIIRIDANNFKLALTKDDAIAGNFITLTSAGDTNNYFLALDTVDYGVSYTTGLAGGIGLTNEHKQTYDHIIYGTQLNDYADLSTTYGYLNVTIPGFRNIGYMVSPKINSAAITDIIRKLVLKFKPLHTSDKIIVKYKVDDVLNFPITTPQDNGNVCSWTDSKTFTITTDLSAVSDYLAADPSNACEVEIISGAGAGQMSQIASITNSSGTYTIVLSDDIDGASSGRQCNVLINNWRVADIGDIDDTLIGYRDYPIDSSGSKWCMVKIILDGVDITVEEQNIVTEVDTGVM